MTCCDLTAHLLRRLTTYVTSTERLPVLAATCRNGHRFYECGVFTRIAVCCLDCVATIP